MRRRERQVIRRGGIQWGVSWIATLLLLTVARPVSAQYLTFGKNKVHYNRFDWHRLESEHFRLYFYPEEEDLARIALEMAEEGYQDLRRYFVHEVDRPIPLIIYSSHQDFEQTNITPFLLPEGVAGLTEYRRGRVLIPFNGSLHDFRTTIHHELVHVFQLSLEERVFTRKSRTSTPGTPLWFIEGLAVSASEGRDTEADMVLRDMVLTGRIPSIDDFWRYNGTFTLYKLGQSVLDFIVDRYGADRVRAIYDNLASAPSFEAAVEAALGIDFAELNSRWAYSVRRLYYPDIMRSEPVSFHSRRLTRGPIDLSPVPVPAGVPGFEDAILFLSPRTGYTNIYATSTARRQADLRVIVRGERQKQFESLHPFRARMDVNHAGELLFVSQRAGEDVIYIYSLPKGRVMEDHRFDDLVGLESPSWSADGNRFVFAGLSRSGLSDLYVFDRATGQLDRLTNDRFEERDPAWEPGGNRIVFSSDRGPGEGRGRNLFLLDLEDRSVRYLTRGVWRDVSPTWMPNGSEILFSSDRDGIFGIYRCGLDGEGGKILGGLEALLDPRISSDGGELYFSCFQGGQFRIHSVPMPSTVDSSTFQSRDAAQLEPPWRWRSPVGSIPMRKGRYSSRLSLEIAQGAVALDPNFRGGQGVQALLADLMGNHLLFIQLGNATFSTDDFLSDFSLGVSYVNQSRRLNFGVSAFHFVGDYLDENGFPYHDRRAGASSILIYPVSKFRRFELINGVAYTETMREATRFERRGAVAQHSIAWVDDTSLWLPTGPIDGYRMNLTLGATLDLQRGKAESSLLIADYRRYLRLGTYSAYAFRSQALFSDGPNPRTFFLGGSLSLRGYPRRGLQGQRSLLVNQEVRFPLVQRWLFHLPIGALEFPAIQGALFLDAGQAWDAGSPPPWIGSFGGGVRMGLGGILVIRVDLARRTDFETVGEKNHWDFFIGWNY